MDEKRATARRRAWDGALHTFATAYIFERRARILYRATRGLTFASLAAPVAVGAIIMAFGTEGWYVTPVIVVASVVVVLQVITATWAVVDNWPEAAAYAAESASANHSLSARYQALAEDPPTSDHELRHELELLETEDRARQGQDLKVGVTERELRLGHRWALRRFKKECDSCGEVPKSMAETTDCGVCGQLNRWEQLKRWKRRPNGT